MNHLRNADDYYGKEAFVKVHDYLVNLPEYDAGVAHYCMAGFILKNTLSENGGVTRGACNVDWDFNLVDVVETHNIVKTRDENGEVRAALASPSEGVFTDFIDADSYVSMNMWGLTPDFFDILEAGFAEFLSSLKPDDVKSEYLLPTIIDGLIKSGKVRVKLLETKDAWFGVTYKEDKQVVVESFKKLIADGVYREKLFT